MTTKKKFQKPKYKRGLTSIIVPVWIPNPDKKQYVKWTLDSLAETTNRQFEIIIVNNETKEDDKEFLKSFAPKFQKNRHCKDFKIIYSKENTGWTGACDIGIENSVGEYVNLTNDDLVFEKNWLSKMQAHFTRDVAAVGPTSNFVSGIQNIKNIKKGDHEIRVNYIIGFCMLIKRIALDDIYDGHYMDPRFYPGGSDELDLCFRMKLQGWELRVACDVFIHHFGSRSLGYFHEYNPNNPMEFFNPRLELLSQKFKRDEIKTFLDFQKCPKFVIGIPTIGKVDHIFVANYPWILKSAWARFGFDSVIPIIAPRNVVHIGRNEIVKRALIYGAEYLMWLDDDMVVPTNVLEILYNHNKDFVSALAYKRTEPYSPCVFKGRDSKGAWMPYLEHHVGLKEVDVTGLSCSLVKMQPIKRLLKKFAREGSTRSLFRFTEFGEDMNFCEDLKKIGVKIWADTNLTIDHLGAEQRVNHHTFDNYRLTQQRSQNNNNK